MNERIPDEIIEKAAGGDIDSFETVYRSLSGFVYNVALRIVNNRQDAEEVTQDVFLILFRRLRDFRFESSLKTWVYRITVNHAISRGRKTFRGRTGNVEYNDACFQPAARHGIGERMEREYTQEIIERLLDSLPPEQRACVVMRGMKGLRYKEIASTLKVNINTVRTRLRRARETLVSLRKKVAYEKL